MPDDPLAGAKAFLAKPSVVPRRKVDTTRDIELPNDTGDTDPRLMKRAPVQTKMAARPSEQPKDMVSNVALRRSLTGGRR